MTRWSILGFKTTYDEAEAMAKWARTEWKNARVMGHGEVWRVEVTRRIKL